MTIGHRTRGHVHSLGVFEALESRSLLSGDPLAATPAADPAPAVQIADADFLNAQSDPIAQPDHAGHGSDADMYDFGGVWGSGSGSHADNAVGEVFSDLEVMDGRSSWTRTPADVLATPGGTHEQSLALRDPSEDHDLPADFSGDAGATDAELAQDLGTILVSPTFTPATASSSFVWIGDTAGDVAGIDSTTIDFGEVAIEASFV